MHKRGQITLFAIIGILLVLVVAIIISLQNVAARERLDAQANAMIEEFVQTNALNHYVTSCLDRVASEGIVLLARQGGVIYDTQGGLTPTTGIGLFQEGLHYYPYSYTTIQGTEPVKISANVSYGIKKYNDCPLVVREVVANLTDESTSYYPAKNTKFQDYISYYTQPYFAQPPGCALFNNNRKIMWSGFLGLNNIDPLCSYDGPNIGAGVCNVLYGFDSPSEPISYERQLKTYIEHELPVCVNFSIYEDILGSNVSVIDSPNVSIYFQQPRGVLVQIKYPFEVSIEGKDPIIKQVDFQKNFPLNLNRLYNFMYILMRNAVRDPYFSIEKDWNNITKNPFYVPSYYVSVTQPDISCDPLEHPNFVCMDDILTIVDQSSTLRGKSLTFHFAIRQRKPVLDYLHDTSSTSVINNQLVNYQFRVNDTISLDIAAMDPDDDVINVTILGWKETRDDFFNLTKCEQEEIVDGCNLDNHWKYIYEKPLATNVANWSSSLSFQSLGFVTQYKTNESDVGLHNVTIIVEDEHKRKDFQIIRILIFDLPKANLTFRNIYADISNSYASVEDPFILNGSSSTASTFATGTLTSYIFEDFTEPFIHTPPFGGAILRLPLDNTNITNITRAWFMKEALTGTSEEHDISLFVRQGDVAISTPDTHTITVAQCLPHGYEGYTTLTETFSRSDFATDPYPFYSGSNPYEASHVCCRPTQLHSNNSLPELLEGGMYAGSTVVCFNDTFVTSYPYYAYGFLARAVIDNAMGITQPITSNRYSTNYGPSSYLLDTYGTTNFAHRADSINFKANNLNDIFIVDFEQSCSDYRGNTCGGKIDTTWTPVSCDDFVGSSVVPNQFARCEGPSTVGFNIESVAETCEQYTGDSFELRLYDWFGAQGESSLLTAFETSYTDDELIWLEDGHCAGPTRASLTTLGNMQLDVNGQFTCMASCDSGECSYEEASNCLCAQGTDCEGRSASEFITGVSVMHVCDSEDRACLPDCSFASTISEAACDCNAGTYFDNQCCTLNDPQTFVTPTQGCLEGKEYSGGEIDYSSSYGSRKVLFCDGAFYVCVQEAYLTTAPELPENFFYATNSETDSNRRPCGSGTPLCYNWGTGQWW